MHWLRIPFIIFGTLVALGVAGTSATLGYNIATASTCTPIDSSYSLGDCRKSFAGIPLSWVHEANDNIVTTVIGSIITIGGAILIVALIVAGLVAWIQSLKKPSAK
jgi:hypothetical protein